MESNTFRVAAGPVGCSDSGRRTAAAAPRAGGGSAEGLSGSPAQPLGCPGRAGARGPAAPDLRFGRAVQRRGRAARPVAFLGYGAADSEAVEAMGRLVGREDAQYLSFRALIAG